MGHTKGHTRSLDCSSYSFPYKAEDHVRNQPYVGYPSEHYRG